MQISDLPISQVRNLIDASLQRNQYDPEQPLGVFLLENLKCSDEIEGCYKLDASKSYG